MTQFARTMNEIHVFFLDARGHIDKLKIVLVISVGFSVISIGIFTATFIQNHSTTISGTSTMPRKILTIDERAQALSDLSSNTVAVGTSTSSPKAKGITEEQKMEILKHLSEQK